MQIKSNFFVYSYVLFFLIMFTTEGDARAVDANSSTAFRLVHYNVENLFDADHDENKNDWEFLPQNYTGRAEYCRNLRSQFERRRCSEKDWTEDKVALKIQQIKRVIEAIEQPRPALLSLAEVENEAVIGRVARALGYSKWFVTNSPDTRGIDVALLVDESAGLNVTEVAEHLVEDSALEKPTRNILQVDLRIPGNQTLSIFVNHWPSQGAASPARVAVAKRLAQVISQKRAQDPSVRVLAVGDFNTISDEQPHPFFDGLHPNLQGITLQDVDLAARRGARSLGIDLNRLSLSSYFFPPRMEWTALDKFFASENLLGGNGLQVDLATYNIVREEFMVHDYEYPENSPNAGSLVRRVPWPYDHQATDSRVAGFSDHFPITVLLRERLQ